MNGDEKSSGDVICSCLGHALPRNDNLSRRKVPFPEMPAPSPSGPAGDRDAKEWMRRLVHEVKAFVDARIPLVLPQLTEEKRRILLSLDYVKQAVFILRCIRDGCLR